MEPREGQRLGRYTLVRRLGKGGGGEAWEAVLHGPRGFTRPVALKFVPPGVAEGPELDNLVHEARVGALLQHPNVVATYELAEANDAVFIALELVRGVTVRELARQGPIPGTVLLDIGIQACAGLAHIHQARVDGVAAGLVHRDIKPGNLLVDQAGVVKVADFGISRRVGDGVHTSGTPGYAPPEQFAGHVDARVDIFGLGATLAAAILSEPPFGRSRDGGTDVIARRLADPAFRARIESRIRGGAAVLAIALAPEPADRYPTASALQDALAGLRSLQVPAPSLRELVEATTITAPTSAGDLTPQLTPVLDAEPTVVLRGNLPPPTDPFVGRPELGPVREALASGHRLVTLTGAGGMGKTRLALEVARGSVGHTGWFFDLSDATTLDGVLGALAAGLSIELGGAEAPTDRVGHALRALGKALVVLDNLEQVVDAARVAIERFLVVAPELTLVCTSRVALRLPAEHRVPVGPLSADEAVVLFRARAPRVIHDDELDDLRSLVSALDGMPLAVELVAARAASFPLPDLRRHLDVHLAATPDDPRPARHRSVDASLAWSWDALPPWGQRALLQLAAFEGGFTSRTAAAVLDPQDLDQRGAIDVLELLVEVGLVRYDREARRFAMATVVHAFVAARLDVSTRDRAFRRHGLAYATLGERDVLALLRGPQGVARFARLSGEADNLAAAARRAWARGDGPVALSALRALSTVLLRRGPLSALLGHLDEAALAGVSSEVEQDELDLLRARCLRAMGQVAVARPIADRALRRIRSRPADPARLRMEAEALLVAGSVHEALHEVGMAEVAARSALELAQTVGDPVLEAEAGAMIATSVADGSRWEESRRWFELALVAFQRLGSARDEARVLADLARAEHDTGRFAQARATYRRALAACREVGDRALEILVLKDLGLLEKDLRRSRDADALYREALHHSAEIGDRATEGWLWGALGYLHLEQLDPADAAGPLEQAVIVARELGEPSVCQWEAALGRLCAARGDFDGARAWIDAATAHDVVRTSTLRVWVRCAAAELAVREGRSADAARELDDLERWLVTRHVEPGSRMHQEVQRVRLLLGGPRR